MTGLEWVFAKKNLGIGSIVVSGGLGGNLSLALTLRASREGKGHLIQRLMHMSVYTEGMRIKGKTYPHSMKTMGISCWSTMETLAQFTIRQKKW